MPARRKPIARRLGRKPTPLPRPFRVLPSPTSYKDIVNPKNYSFQESSHWIYYDWHKVRCPHLVLKDKKGTPRFTLMYEPKPQKYEVDPQSNQISILAIQREKPEWIHTIGKERVRLNQYKPVDEKGNLDKIGILRRLSEQNRWDDTAENLESKAFQAELGGMHPAEFLLSEFIHQKKEAIRNGTKVMLHIRSPFLTLHYQKPTQKLPSWENRSWEEITKEVRKTRYGPIIERFFYRKPTSIITRSVAIFELNLNKKRVRQILGLP